MKEVAVHMFRISKTFGKLSGHLAVSPHELRDISQDRYKTKWMVLVNNCRRHRASTEPLPSMIIPMAWPLDSEVCRYVYGRKNLQSNVPCLYTGPARISVPSSGDPRKRSPTLPLPGPEGDPPQFLRMRFPVQLHLHQSI